MFDIAAENNIKNAIACEYIAATTNYGMEYNSEHEGFAVLLEELEEAQAEFCDSMTQKGLYWRLIKGEKMNFTKSEVLDQLEKSATAAIQELVQVVAVVKKIKKTREGVL